MTESKLLEDCEYPSILADLERIENESPGQDRGILASIGLAFAEKAKRAERANRALTLRVDELREQLEYVRDEHAKMAEDMYRCTGVPELETLAGLIRSRGPAPERPVVAGADHVPGERSTAEYSDLAIAVARADGRLRVDADGLGWIHDMEPDKPAPVDHAPERQHHEYCDTRDEVIKGKPCNCKSSLWTTPSNPEGPLSEATVDPAVTAPEIRAAVDAVEWPREPAPVDPVREAARLRVEAGHNDTCAKMLGGKYGCSCGHDELALALENTEASGG